MNFEALSTSLNLKMDVLISHKNINNNNDIETINGISIHNIVILIYRKPNCERTPV